MMTGRSIGATIYLEMKKLYSVCLTCMLPDRSEFHHDNNWNCLYGNLMTPLLWACRNNVDYQRHVHDQTNGVVVSVDDFDAFVFGLMDPNRRGVLTGANIVLRDWYHCKMVRHNYWPAAETRDELEEAWRNATAAFILRGHTSSSPMYAQFPRL